MATTRMIFTRSLLTTTTKQTLSPILSRSCTSSVAFHSTPPPSSLSLRRLCPLFAANIHRLSPPTTVDRGYATEKMSSSCDDPNHNGSKRPEGMDFEHWLFVLEKPEGNPTREEIIDTYIKTLAQVVGSEDEARMKIYSVLTRRYFAFGALVSKELAKKVGELPKVRCVVPDSYSDVGNKDYGGEPFINGQALPYDPKYHEEGVQNIVKDPNYLKPIPARPKYIKPGSIKRPLYEHDWPGFIMSESLRQPLYKHDRPKYIKLGSLRRPLYKHDRPKYIKPGSLRRPLYKHDRSKYIKPGSLKRPLALRRPFYEHDRPKYMQPGSLRRPFYEHDRPEYIEPGFATRPLRIPLPHENRSRKLRSLHIPLQLSMGKEAFQSQI